MQVLGFRQCKRSLEERLAGRDLARDRDNEAGRCREGKEEILGFGVRVLELRWCKEGLEGREGGGLGFRCAASIRMGSRRSEQQLRRERKMKTRLLVGRGPRCSLGAAPGPDHPRLVYRRPPRPLHCYTGLLVTQLGTLFLV
jgi:hypothetical protein